MEFALLFGLILLNGLFAMAEIALVTARKARLGKLAEEGDHAAAVAMRLGEDPTTFLSTIQIGITSISILNGIVGEATLAGPFSKWMVQEGVPENWAGNLATGIIVVCITYVSIVLGELVPKRLGQLNPEPLARLVARPMQLLATVGRPFVKLLSGSTEAVLRLMGVRDTGQQAMTEEDLHMALAEGSDSGVIEEQEHKMLRNVFRLDDRQITSFMVPRRDVVYFDASDEPSVNLRRFNDSRHSRYPVLRGGWREVLGVTSARSMLAQMLNGHPMDFTADLKPAVFVPESLTGMELLEHFKHSGAEITFIVDEYGEVMGIVTLQDVLEAITGEFKTPHPEEAWATQRHDGSWLLDGLIPIPELKDRLALKSVPEEEHGRYNTLSGMLMLLIGDIPHTGQRCQWEGWDFEVVDLDGLRIDKVLASRLPQAEAAEPAGS